MASLLVSTTCLTPELGLLGIDGNIEEVYVFDNDWSNADGSGNIEAGHGAVTFEGIPAEGKWVKMEMWMSEGGGGDAGIIYLANEDDPDLFNVADEAALTREQRDKFIVPAENLRGEGIVLLSADANAALSAGLEYQIQVGADGSHDSLDIDNNGGSTPPRWMFPVEPLESRQKRASRKVPPSRSSEPTASLD